MLRLDYVTRRFAAAASRQIGNEQRRVTAMASKLDALSPLKVLGRGYAIPYRADGQTLASVKQTAVDDMISLQISDGTVDCRVTNIQEA